MSNPRISDTDWSTPRSGLSFAEWSEANRIVADRYAAGSETSSAREIPAQLASMEQSIVELTSAIDKLLSRMAPVVAESDVPPAIGQQEINVGSPTATRLGSDLQVMAHRIRHLTERVSQATHRLEI